MSRNRQRERYEWRSIRGSRGSRTKSASQQRLIERVSISEFESLKEEFSQFKNVDKDWRS